MVLSFLVLGAQMYGDRTASIRDEIQQAYAGYARAVVHRDLDATMGYLTPDVVWVQRGKKSEREDIRKNMRAWEETIKDGSKFWFTLEKLKVFSPEKVEATVSGHFLGAGDKEERKGPKVVWHDTWVKDNGRWQNSVGIMEVLKG